MMAPLVVFPAALLLMLGTALVEFDLKQVGDAFSTFFLVGGWSAAIAYVVAFLYGIPIWLILWKLKRLNIVWLSGCALLPAFVLLAVTRDVGLLLMVGYFSLSVSTAGWFIGRRSIGGI
ncbi:hypothetical protein [Methylophaga sp. UBA3603]|nr:hypothetical protein [Methylophaga sp. UBA3603]